MTVLLLNENYNIWAIEIKIGRAYKTKTVVVFVFYSSHKIPPSNSLFSLKNIKIQVLIGGISQVPITQTLAFSQDVSHEALVNFLCLIDITRGRFL